MIEKCKCPYCKNTHNLTKGYQDFNFYETEIVRYTEFECHQCGRIWGYYENFIISSAYNEKE